LRYRQELFVRSIKDSFAVLCLPGVGPQSVRLYEAMYLGRIPVLFGQSIVYPLESKIDYAAFALFIEPEQVVHTGRILREWFALQSRDSLRQRWIAACKTWNDFFAPERKLENLLAEAKEKFGF
jgi:hypothetical protein